MISLRTELESADRLDRQKRELTYYYLSAIEICAKHAIEVPTEPPAKAEATGARASQLKPQEALQAAVQLKALYNALLQDDSPDALASSLVDFENCIRGHSAALRASLAGANQDVRLVLELLREATQAMESSHDRVGSEVIGFAARLQETIDANDLGRIRTVLAEQVQQMKEWVSSLHAQAAAQLDPLQLQLRVFEERLQDAEHLAATDPLTKLYNRREGERLVGIRIGKQCPFSLLVIDLNRFKFINDEYGHQCGDRVLAFVAARLSESIRPTDTVCRWGGDEFVILLDCALDIARRRAVQLGEQIEGHFLFEAHGRITAIPVSAAIGVAAYQTGETFEDVFNRADVEMYRHKQGQATAPAAEPDPKKASIYAKF
jgi:diguanylate cyclase (GGDEF)-like protein